MTGPAKHRITRWADRLSRSGPHVCFPRRIDRTPSSHQQTASREAYVCPDSWRNGLERPHPTSRAPDELLADSVLPGYSASADVSLQVPAILMSCHAPNRPDSEVLTL